MMKKATEFVAEVKINYSDDTAGSFEKRFVWRPTMTYQDFMQECDKFYGFVRATFGATEFDELQKKNEEADAVEDNVKVEAVDNTVPFKKGE